jgi:hypothetical protein
LDAPIEAQIELQATTLLGSSQGALMLIGKRIDDGLAGSAGWNKYRPTPSRLFEYPE